MADVATGTDKAELKQLLRRATEESPAKCAAAQPKEGAHALLIVHRTKMGKALSAEIEKTFSGNKNSRWGVAWPEANRNPPPPGVELEAADEKLVVFLVNRPASGLAKRLAKTLKLNQTGFNKVELRFEDGSESERAHDEEDAEAPSVSPTAPPPQPVQQTAPGPDAATLTKELAALIHQFGSAAGGDETRKATLSKLANAAGAAIKSGDLAAAAKAIAGLTSMVAPTNGTTPPSTKGAVNYAKSRLAWIAARRKLESEVEKLQAEMLDYFDGHGIGPQLTDAYKKRVAPVLEALDEALADKLDEAANADDPSKRAELVAEARAEIDRYTAFVANDPTIRTLDGNPFVPLTIRHTMEATLSVLHASVR